jgi:hypothetical protein
MSGHVAGLGGLVLTGRAFGGCPSHLGPPGQLVSPVQVAILLSSPRRRRFHLLEHIGSFGHLEEPNAVFEHLRNFWTCLKT